MRARSGVIPRVGVSRYVTPLREGGSLPGLVEAEDLGIYVCKFSGAGQGVRVLVAEVLVSEIARRIGLRTPRLVALELDGEIARYEADEEVQDLLTASLGLNLGVDFLPGAFGFDGAQTIEPGVAERILWLDAFTANVDRSWRNPNLLVWHGDVWVIDHGAALYFHHAWTTQVTDPQRFAAQPWDSSDHVLGEFLGDLGAADAAARAVLSTEVFTDIVALVPEEWLTWVPGVSPAELRTAYVEFLTARLGSRQWLPGGAA
ncbi:HipA family kinase [Nocardioides sp. 616]|uniref:HipA family kinase n=1 Tax=Nocardioides sp. 616 TaxID=2268090 RepID=UPI000CE47D83|nr:HipA family kinase [Nocardioides sp. 616]